MANEQIKKYSYDVVAVYMTNIAKREDIIIIFTEIQEKNKQNTCRTKWQLISFMTQDLLWQRKMSCFLYLPVSIPVPMDG